MLIAKPTKGVPLRAGVSKHFSKEARLDHIKLHDGQSPNIIYELSILNIYNIKSQAHKVRSINYKCLPQYLKV